MDLIFPHIQTKTNSKPSEIHLIQIVAQIPNINKTINIQWIVYGKLILPQVVKKLYFKKTGSSISCSQRSTICL